MDANRLRKMGLLICDDPYWYCVCAWLLPGFRLQIRETRNPPSPLPCSSDSPDFLRFLGLNLMFLSVRVVSDFSLGIVDGPHKPPKHMAGVVTGSFDRQSISHKNKNEARRQVWLGEARTFFHILALSVGFFNQSCLPKNSESRKKPCQHYPEFSCLHRLTITTVAIKKSIFCDNKHILKTAVVFRGIAMSVFLLLLFVRCVSNTTF